MMSESLYTLNLRECGGKLELVGGKCQSLGDLIAAGLPVPPGFAITAHAFKAHLSHGDTVQDVKACLDGLDHRDTSRLDAVSAEVRHKLETLAMPAEVEQAIRDAYEQLCASVGVPDLPVAVRSSATAEDLPGASFAGQQDTYLWVIGADAVVDKARQCWGSQYTARAIAYRCEQGFPHDDVAMAVAVQKMVNSKVSGVAMTLNPANGDRSKIVIDASYGLGETVVSGEVTPDNILMDKILLTTVKQTIGHKHVELVPDVTAGKAVIREVSPERQAQSALSPAELEAVARIAKQAEKHFRCPQDIEWAIDHDLPDGENLLLLQSRPETVWSQKPKASTITNSQTGMAGILGTLLRPMQVKTEAGQDTGKTGKDGGTQ